MGANLLGQARVAVDLCDSAAVAAALAPLLPAPLLVNCAGAIKFHPPTTAGCGATAAELGADFDLVFGVNVKAMLSLTQARPCSCTRSKLAM